MWVRNPFHLFCWFWTKKHLWIPILHQKGRRKKRKALDSFCANFLSPVFGLVSWLGPVIFFFILIILTYLYIYIVFILFFILCHIFIFFFISYSIMQDLVTWVLNNNNKPSNWAIWFNSDSNSDLSSSK